MIAILKYNAGNTRSVQHAIERLGYSCSITDDEAELRNAQKIIFPGVGEAGTVMNYLAEKGLDRIIPTLTQPFLGICLGLQLMCSHTEESDTKGLGIFDVSVKQFPPDQLVPHMGWNTLKVQKAFHYFEQAGNKDYYFVHSYYAPVCLHTIAECEYGITFSAVLQKDNFFATQFHPEKSSRAGESFLKTFLTL
jgi:glutamine amidotransferase